MTKAESNWAAFALIPVWENGSVTGFLLIREGKDDETGMEYEKKLWKLPGGKQERKDQTKLDTIKRELVEELGESVNFEVVEKIYDDRKNGHDFAVFLFQPVDIDLISGVDIEGEPEIDEWEVFSPKELEIELARHETGPKGEFLDNHAEVLSQVLQYLLREPA